MNVSHQGQTASPPNILVIEDDPGVRRSLLLLLRAHGYGVTAMVGDNPALDPLQSNPACLIADYRLGDTDGIAVLKSMRARGWQGPAIMMTAYHSEDVEDQAMSVGYTTVLEKPLKPHSLVTLVRQMIS